MKDVELSSFIDNNTIYLAWNSIEELIKVLEKESKSNNDWFKMNDMMVNPHKFQSMITRRQKKENKFFLNMYNWIISSVDSITQLGIEVHNKSNFEKHVLTIYRKASRKLNAISWIQSYIGKKEKEIIINTFVYFQFIHYPLAQHFCSKSSQNKIKKSI